MGGCAAEIRNREGRDRAVARCRAAAAGAVLTARLGEDHGVGLG